MARSLCGTSEEAEGREWEPSWAETSPEAGSAFSLQSQGPPCEVQAGSPRLAAQVQRHPSTTTLLKGGCSQPSGGGADAHPSVPWQGSAPWGLGADLGLPSIWGPLLARVGCGHLVAAGPREHPSLGGSVGRVSLLPWSPRRALWGADEAPSLPASPGGLGTGKLLSWDMKGHFINLAK